MKIQDILVVVTFLAIFFLEGLGIKRGHDITFAIILVTPYILNLLDVLKNQVVAVPKWCLIWFGLFLAFSVISTVLSSQQNDSFRYVLFYNSLFLIFVFAYNHAAKLEKILDKIIIGYAVFFSFYSLVLPSVLHLNTFLLPRDGYQYVFPKFGIHNHLGDFVILAILISVYWLLKKKDQIISLTLSIFFIPFLLFSYSRSAFTALLGSLLIMTTSFLKRSGFNFKVLACLTVLICIVLSFFLVTVGEVDNVPTLGKATTTFREQTGVRERTLMTDRISFWQQSLHSIQVHPFFGIGPNQFEQLSKRYFSQMGFSTVSSHNLFIDIFVENGILAGISFALFIGYCILKSKKKLYFFLVLAMLLNFQSDYTFKIYSYFYLFFCLMGVIMYNGIHEKEKAKSK